MADRPVDVVRAVLGDPTNLETMRKLVANDVTYVSLNDDEADLKKIMPWAGTGHGPEAIVDTFAQVGRYWEKQAFAIEEIFDSGENVAVFGRFTYKSSTLGKVVTSPFAILSKVVAGKVTYMQFMEDTFATALSFRSSGEWHFRSDPDGGEVVV